MLEEIVQQDMFNEVSFDFNSRREQNQVVFANGEFKIGLNTENANTNTRIVESLVAHFESITMNVMNGNTIPVSVLAEVMKSIDPCKTNRVVNKNGSFTI